MDHRSQHFPFISVPDGTQLLLSERSLQRDERLDHLGESKARELYWNGEMYSMGLVLPTTVPSQQAGRIETPSTLEQPQTIARLEPLIACISRLCSRRPHSRVPYKIVEQEMSGRMAEIESLGWYDFGMLMEAAYKENVVEPIRKGRKSKIKFLRLIPQSPRPLPLPQVEYSMAPTMPCITSIAPQVGHPIAILANAMDYPVEHRPVVVTMLRLMSVTPGAGVPMVELAKALGRDYPYREGDYYLISRAEEAGIISTGEYSGSWAYLNSPPTHPAPIQMSLPVPPWIPAQNPPLQLTSTMAGTSHYAFEHPLVTSAILELTGGAWDAKVRLVDLIASLLRSCSGAEGTVLPVLFQAKQNGLTMDETDVTGTIWVWLRSPPHTGFTALSNHILAPPPEPAYPVPTLTTNTALLGGLDPMTGVLKPPIPEDYPLAHREVVATVLKLTRGIVGEKIRVADLASSLAHYFPTSQGPWYLIFQAQESGILKQETGGTGVTWVYLERAPTSAVVPPPSETAPLLTSSPQHVPQSEPIQQPKRILSGQTTTMEATASTSASQAPTKKFIVDIIPYGETRHAANPMRKDVEENSPMKSKPSGAEAQEHDISPKAVEKEVDSRTRQGRRPSLGMLIDAAFELMVVEPGVPPPATPPHASQSISTQFSTDMRSEPLNAMDEDQRVPTPSPPPAVRVNTNTSPPAKKITTVSCPPRYRAVVASLITLTDGTPRKKVRIDDWMSLLRCDYPGAREEFLLSVTAKAEKDGVVARGRSKDGAQWAWLNPEEANETSAITQRIIASHMNEPEAQVLVLHTDHSSIRGGPCSLLNSTWGQTIVLVSVIQAYSAEGIPVVPIAFKETSITLRHILSLFTPPEKMRGASSIIGTLRLVLSQLEEPFGLQRFIELVDQEEWGQEGVNFMALRQTLLTKLLSPVLDTVHEDKQWRTTLVDLTDPVLSSTGLDSAIMDIALCDFLCSGDGRKMIVFSNCQQYLTHDSHLTKSLEAIAALGSDRPTRVILSTTEPNFVSSPLLNSLDYVVLGSTRSLIWSAFLRKHFAIDSAKQSRRGRAMIWSPESTSLVHNFPEDTLQKPWNDELVWIEIARLKQSMPVIPPDLSLAGSSVQGLTPNRAGEGALKGQAPKEGTSSADISRKFESGGEQDDEEEEGILSLDKLGLNQSNDPLTNDQPPSNPPNEVLPTPTTTEEPKPTETSPTLDPIQIFAKFEPLIACISQLGGANVGSQVDYKSVKQMMASRKLEIIGLGSFGHMIDSAYQAGFLKPVKNKPNGKTKLLELLVPLPLLRPVGPSPQPADPTYIPSPPPDLTQAVPTISPDRAESEQVSSLGCPLKHSPVVSAIVALAEGSTTFKVRLVDLTNTLLRNHRGAEVVVAPLIREAIDDGIILQEKENPHLTWVWLSKETKDTNHPPTVPTLPPNLGKLGSTKPAAHMRSGPLDALTCPLKHIPVFSTMLELTGGEVGAKVRLMDLSNSLLLNHRGADVVVGPLILEAKEDGILVQEKDSAGVLWVWINDAMDTPPPASPENLPTPLPSPPPAFTHTATNRITTARCPPKHRAVVAALITLTDGIPGKKVCMADWIISLRGEYPGAREEFLLSLIAKAEEDGVMTRGRSKDGVQWAWLNPEKDFQTAPVRPDFRPEPERQEGLLSPTVDDYPAAHRAVVSVIQSMNGSVRTKVSVGSVWGALCDRKYASTSPGAMDMIAAARTAKVIRVNGEQILLEDPGLSRDGFLSAI